jgi:endonuclease YncB( thermonuclease family)
VSRKARSSNVIAFKRRGARSSQNRLPHASLGSDRSTKRIDPQVLLLAVLLFFGVFGAGSLYLQSAWRTSGGTVAIASTTKFTCEVAHITDGDTFRCADGTRVRLSGVAARESDGTCRPGHPCPAASAEAATAALHNIASGQVVVCRAVGETYGRVAAFCRRQDGLDLSCAMMQTGTVKKWWRYWGLHSC